MKYSGWLPRNAVKRAIRTTRQRRFKILDRAKLIQRSRLHENRIDYNE